MKRLPFFYIFCISGRSRIPIGFEQGDQANQCIHRLRNAGDDIQNQKRVDGPKANIDQNTQLDAFGLFGEIGADCKLYAGDDGQQADQSAVVGQNSEQQDGG